MTLRFLIYTPGVPLNEENLSRPFTLQRENIEAKENRLRKAFGTIPANVKLVLTDFERDDLGAVLASAGYSVAKRTFFVCEAVTQYLTEQGVRATFDFLAKAARGSRLAFTYVRKDF